MREIITINDNWLFSKTCREAPAVMPEASADWTRISLPHTWNAVDGMVGVPFERGAYW